MYKINKLLFPEIEATSFDPELVNHYELSVKDLIAIETRKEIQKAQALICPDLLQETNKTCKPLKESNKNKKLKREQTELELKDWFGFKKRDLTEQDEQDLEILKLRKYINPKNFGGRTDDQNKNYMQIGTILDDPLAGKAGRIKKRDRKERILDQFKSEDKHIGFTEKKFQEIQSKKMDNSRNKRWIKMKKIKSRKNNLVVNNKAFDFN